MARTTQTSTAWEQFLIANPHVEDEIAKQGLYEVEANDIKRFREPRLMIKHDSSESVPKPLKNKGINVLSASRHSYYLGTFNVFERLPETSDLEPQTFSLPDYETLDIEHISSEAVAINALNASGILNEFIGENGTVETFSGRMGTGAFEFNIAKGGGPTFHIKVNNAQLEIDGGFENEDSVIIMEAKNVIHDDFNIRQLYYPYRKYKKQVSKPIRLVFSQYTNLTYYLFEYTFLNPFDFNSIALVQKKAFTLSSGRITADDVWRAWKNTTVIYDDSTLDGGTVPFPQANRIDRILSLAEFLSAPRYSDGATTNQITEFMGTVERQAAYYPAAGRYLGIFDKPQTGYTSLTKRGRELLSHRQKRDRLLTFAGYIFEHKLFHNLYKRVLETGKLPDRTTVTDEMKKLHVLIDNNEHTLKRRAATVTAWLKWLQELPDN